MARKILIQCQSITYFYNALGAIYTKYPNEDIETDVIVTNRISLADKFIEKLKQSKYVKNIYSFDYACLSKINKKIQKNKKTPFNIFLFRNFYKPQICKIIKNITKQQAYDDVVYSHETQTNLISYLKFTYPNANFIMYGDGAGVIMGSSNQAEKPFEYKFFAEMKPNEIIAVAPYMEDNSIDVKNIPISAIDTRILVKIIEEDEQIQRDINKFTEEILNKYSNCKNKTLLLTSQLDDPKYRMTKDDQINIYLDIINRYCTENSLVILKLHPTTSEDILSVLKENCKKECEFIFIPKELKEYPVEIYCKLIKNMDFVITFLSSSGITLPCLYGIKTIDALEIVQNYPLKAILNPILNSYREIANRYSNWDKKSIIYKYDLAPIMEKYHKEQGEVQKTQKHHKKLSSLQKIFSITNVYSDYSKKKQIVILGIKVTV